MLAETTPLLLEPVPRPVSAALEAELRTQVREQGIVIWLDGEGTYTTFVDSLKQRPPEHAFPYPVFAFRGSFLELLLQLEGHGNDLTPDKLLIHLPGFNEEKVAETPVFELYKAGNRYRRALTTLVEETASGLARPADIQAFLKTTFSLEQADAWLSGARVTGDDAFLLSLEARTMDALLADILTPKSPLYEQIKAEVATDQLAGHLHRRLGVPMESWATFLGLPKTAQGIRKLQANNVPYFILSWLMAVEFTWDLKEPPTTKDLLAISQLPDALQKECKKLVTLVRQQSPEVYRAHAIEFEARLAGEVDAHQADKLGSIDTFRFEEGKVRAEALRLLLASNWAASLGYATSRKPETCFWVQHDKALANTWQLISLAAEVGAQITAESKGLRDCTSLEEATERYRLTLFRVDAAHRRFEQAYHKLHTSEIDDEGQLRQARDVVRSTYRKWADSLAREFAELCEKNGPLPPADLRQREVYEQFVQPIIKNGERVAFFMVDAMRFELAEELREVFIAKKFVAKLSARLAELPTLTSVGMNALAPVARQGRLTPIITKRKFEGMQPGDGPVVRDPGSRVRAMASRSVGGQAIELDLADVVALSDEQLRTKLRSKNSSDLIVIKSLEFDSAGESGFGLVTFEHTLQHIREAVQRLQKAGITHFVLAADHGFLLQDSSTDPQEYHDAPERRHVLSSKRSGMADAFEIPLSALDYDTKEEGYLVFRKDTATWKVPGVPSPFVHGGNSLQERVIPILVLEKKAKVGASNAKYEVLATALPAELGRQRLMIQLRLQKLSSGLLSFAGPKRISLALRVPGQDLRPEIIEVGPPGQLETGVLTVPPGSDAIVVTFVVKGDLDEKVRVEVYHPDGIEEVIPQLVEGWFDVRSTRRTATAESRRDGKPSSRKEGPRAPAQAWADSFEDAEFRQVFATIESQESINEQELQELLKSPRRVRAFARAFDELKGKVPFVVEITTVNGMKSYVKGGVH